MCLCGSAMGALQDRASRGHVCAVMNWLLPSTMNIIGMHVKAHNLLCLVHKGVGEVCSLNLGPSEITPAVVFLSALQQLDVL